MRTIRIVLILSILSLQANATGYVHNMFVAHKKLQTGKELVSEKSVGAKVKANKQKKSAPAKQANAFNAQLTSQTASATTLNERILAEGPGAFFNSGKEESSDESIVVKLVGAVRCMIYTFLGLPNISNS
jgi:hypothetical protein